jgi:hypothetical protein
VNYETLYENSTVSLAAKTSAEFARAARLIATLNDRIYAKVGGHFRHNLDFANSFLNGLAGGMIDYHRRERDPRVESDRRYAIERVLLLTRRLRNLSVTETELFVSSEIEPGVRHRSSVARELEFLHSHTVHHHALIAEKLRSAGVKLSADFGVAPSTLEFWKSRNAA